MRKRERLTRRREPNRHPTRVAGRTPQQRLQGAHRSYLTLATSIATLLATVIALITLWVMFREDSPQIETIAFAIDTVTEVDGTEEVVGDGPITPSREPTTAMDITVINSGNEPELITELRIVLREVKFIVCPGGGGGVSVEAEYDFKIPDYAPEIAMPQIHTKSVRFELEPNRVDRLRVTLGPETIQYAVGAVDLYAFDLFAVTASNPEQPSLLGQGKIAAANSEVATFLRDLNERASVDSFRDCLVASAADLRHMESLPGSTSPEYRAVAERMRMFNSEFIDESTEQSSELIDESTEQGIVCPPTVAEAIRDSTVLVDSFETSSASISICSDTTGSLYYHGLTGAGEIVLIAQDLGGRTYQAINTDGGSTYVYTVSPDELLVTQDERVLSRQSVIG